MIKISTIKYRKMQGGFCMSERLTWEEIQERYPDQWVGLVDVKYVDDDGISIESAVIKYLDKTKSELTMKALNGEIVSRYTTPDHIFQLGMLGALR
jgi:hypothetical protein